MILTINVSKLTSKETELWICFLKLHFDLFSSVPIQEYTLCISVPLYYCWVWCHKLRCSLKNGQCRCSGWLELIYSTYSSLLGCRLGVLFFKLLGFFFLSVEFFPISWVFPISPTRFFSWPVFLCLHRISFGFSYLSVWSNYLFLRQNLSIYNYLVIIYPKISQLFFLTLTTRHWYFSMRNECSLFLKLMLNLFNPNE